MLTVLSQLLTYARPTPTCGTVGLVSLSVCGSRPWGRNEATLEKRHQPESRERSSGDRCLALGSGPGHLSGSRKFGRKFSVHLKINEDDIALAVPARCFRRGTRKEKGKSRAPAGSEEDILWLTCFTTGLFCGGPFFRIADHVAGDKQMVYQVSRFFGVSASFELLGHGPTRTSRSGDKKDVRDCLLEPRLHYLFHLIICVLAIGRVKKVSAARKRTCPCVSSWPSQLATFTLTR